MRGCMVPPYMKQRLSQEILQPSNVSTFLQLLQYFRCSTQTAFRLQSSNLLKFKSYEASSSISPYEGVFFVGWDLRHHVLRPLLAYCTAPDDRWGWLWSNCWNEDWQGKPKYSEKTCPSAILSTTNPTWRDPCANTGRRGGKPVTNRLSYGAALGGRFPNLRLFILPHISLWFLGSYVTVLKQKLNCLAICVIATKFCFTGCSFVVLPSFEQMCAQVTKLFLYYVPHR
jgi:hypothetical protein